MFVRHRSAVLWLVVIGLVASSAVAQDSRRGRGRGYRGRQGDTPNGQDGAQNRQNDVQSNSEARGPQAATDNTSEQRRGDRTDGRGDRGSGRRDRGNRGGPPREFTPEDRERFYSGMVDRYMERYSRNYELTDAQKEQVRGRLEEIKTQQRAFSEQHAGEFQALRQEFWQLRSSGGEPDPQKYRELRERFEALRGDSPLFNDDRVVENVEQLLPPEQVQAGRARRQAESAARDQEREQRRQQWEQRRQQRETQAQQENPPADGQVQGQPAPMPPTMDRPDGQHQHGSDREARRREWQDRHQRGDSGRGESHRHDAGEGAASVDQGQFVGQSGQVAQPSTVIPENPVGPWEQYVRDFTRQFKLDDAQQATAQSVLREVQKRRVSYEQTHREDFEAARRLDASGDREKRLADLNKPVVSMFEELKSRLNRIPSSAQRQAAGVVSVATSRPSFSTVITTRPARERNTANPSGDSNR